MFHVHGYTISLVWADGKIHPPLQGWREIEICWVVLHLFNVLDLKDFLSNKMHKFMPKNSNLRNVSFLLFRPEQVWVSSKVICFPNLWHQPLKLDYKIRAHIHHLLLFICSRPEGGKTYYLYNSWITAFKSQQCDWNQPFLKRVEHAEPFCSPFPSTIISA